MQAPEFDDSEDEDVEDGWTTVRQYDADVVEKAVAEAQAVQAAEQLLSEPVWLDAARASPVIYSPTHNSTEVSMKSDSIIWGDIKTHM